MVEKIRNALIDLSSAIQAGKIYSTKHPKFTDFILRAHKSFKEVLTEKKELVIGIVEEELAWEEEIFFRLSQKLKTLIHYLQERNIERIVFFQGLQEEELIRFISFLIEKKKEALPDIQEYLTAIGAKNIRAGKIRTIAAVSSETPPPSKSQKQRENNIHGVSQIIENVLNEEDVDYMELKFNVLNYMEDFMGRRQELIDLVSIKKKDLNTFLHLLNVSIIAMYVSSQLGYSQEDVLDLGIAGLFHDIGKLAVSPRILKKKSKLKEEEYFKIKHHTTRGAEILVKYSDAIGYLPAVVAFEHHLRYDLKGYPPLVFSQKPHPASLLISICDVYDALAQRRTYKKDYPPLKIYNIMMEGRETTFHPRLLEDFFRVFGVWPIGTIVSLSDGSISVVRAVNGKDLFRPKVEVLYPEEKKGIISLLDEDKKLFIEKSLNPYKEGKKYFELIQSP
jgi:putative nucleotidyltransferase with HDIG domain